MQSESNDKFLTPDQLKQIRKRTGLSQSKFAPLLGLTNSRIIRRYEAGEKLPPDSILEQYHRLRDGKL